MASAKQKKSKKKLPPQAWKPGQSGNPNGRPKVGNTVAELARKVLESQHEGDKTKCEAILDKFVDLAIDGSRPHADFIFERGYGKVKDVIESLPPAVDEETALWFKFVRENKTAREQYLAYLKNHEG